MDNKNYFKIILTCIVMVHIATYAQARKVRVLFAGNSYTYVNDLPKLVADMAASTGDTLEYETSALGGVSFVNHVDSTTTDLQTPRLIKKGGWDYIIMQEQSLGPAVEGNLYYMYTFTYAKILVDLARRYNPCVEPIFYMTWGRKNGLPQYCSQWYGYCNYTVMDSIIRSRYMEMADSNKTSVSPVGAVWRYIRMHYPNIELYDGDESHPSPAGSYAGACSFYTAIFKKPADSIRYNFSLSAADAANIRKAATKVVYDSVGYWHIGQYETIAAFTHNANGMLPVSFTNKSANAATYNWSFGDGNTSTAANPTHTYTTAGTYKVRLIAINENTCSDTSYTTLIIQPLSIANQQTSIFSISPNPTTGTIHIKANGLNTSTAAIQITDALGRLIYNNTAHINTSILDYSISLGAYPAGVYTVHIQAGNYNNTIKLSLSK